MNTEVLLEIAESVLLCLPSRLRDKYFKLKTELSGMDLKSSAPDFGSVELRPLTRSNTTEYQHDPLILPQTANKSIQAPHDPFVRDSINAATQSELPVLHFLEVSQITEILDQIYLVLRRLRSSIAPAARTRAQSEAPSLFSEAINLLSIPDKDNDLLICVLNGCKSILEEAECCSRNFSVFSKNLSESAAASRVASSTLTNMEKENTKLQSIICERDRQISQLLSEAELYNKVQSALKEQNHTLEYNMNVLQQRIDGFDRKMNDSDRLFKECNTAYLSSLTTLRKEAEKQISHLGNQLAITHDRLRRMKGRVEDLSATGSILTASILADS
ncbi:hypothetical protein GL50803_0010979 [Giardia duodenalis]|uniref:Uncharacterized protein n=2 Tax=Giardia intestinalis TaxID=5741 RepID=D3KGU2_GIAIC|nr:hypothetical protein GL50803_0010979 [Giardia intestinalis]ESU39361.1 Hypothetical protein DHA2_10979 [Giardia intestinalis]KAE8302026.1 hypothetical protein GL50803_0010979 [Giardia intestinalis]